MKQLFFILSVSFFFFVFGCNNDDSIPINPSNNGNVPPNVPSHPFPAADTTITSGYHIVFSWTGGDRNATDTVTYDIYVGNTNPPTTLFQSGLTLPACDFGIPFTGDYYWKVTAKDQKGLMATGPDWHFRVQ